MYESQISPVAISFHFPQCLIWSLPSPSKCRLWTRELLDAVVVRVRDVDVAAPVHGDCEGADELPVPATPAAPRAEEGPGVRELLDAVVEHVRDEDVPAPIHGDARGVVELPATAAPYPCLTHGGTGLEALPPVLHSPAEGEEEGACVRELLDALVRLVGDEDRTARVRGNPTWGGVMLG